MLSLLSVSLLQFHCTYVWEEYILFIYSIILFDYFILFCVFLLHFVKISFDSTKVDLETDF
jgi:hypothetical protein